MRKAIIQLFVISIFSLVIVNQTAAWTCACTATAQESTQIANKIQLIKQLAEQVQMVKNQYQMLRQLTGSMASGLNGANSQIFEQFRKVQDVWKSAESLTHAMDNFTDLHNKRHPEHLEGTQVKAEEERRRRDKEYKQMLDSYLKGINMNALDFENREKMRQKLMDTLQSTEGQVQAIQALGGLINHTSMLVDKNTEVVSGYVTMFAENEQDRRDQEDTENKNLQLAIQGAKNERPTGKGHKPKFQW